MSHDRFRELAAGRVLGDIDAAEDAALDDHLAGCGRCRSELRALDETAALMALAAPPRRPPADLRDRVLAAITGAGAASTPAIALAGPSPVVAIRWAEGGIPAPSPAGWGMAAGGSPETPAPLASDRERRLAARPSRPWTALAGLAAAAVLVVAVTAIGVSVVGLRGQLDGAIAAADAARAEAALARADAAAARGEADALAAELATMDSAMGVALAPSHRTAALSADTAVPELQAWAMFVPGTSDALLVARGLPPAPADHVYQLWYADAAGVHALATFSCSAGSTCVVPFGIDLGRAVATMVTVEPVGGSTGSPGPQVVFGELQG